MMIFEKLQSWVTHACLYPVMEIYGDKNLGEQTKEEKRVRVLCEEVFKLSSQSSSETLPRVEMANAWRELCVALKMSQGFPVKPEYVAKCKEKFLETTKDLISLLEATYKKEKVLQEYYSSWKIKQSEIKDLVYHLKGA